MRERRRGEGEEKERRRRGEGDEKERRRRGEKGGGTGSLTTKNGSKYMSI